MLFLGGFVGGDKQILRFNFSSVCMCNTLDPIIVTNIYVTYAYRNYYITYFLKIVKLTFGWKLGSLLSWHSVDLTLAFCHMHILLLFGLDDCG